jgi:hypothetical protein
MIRVNHRAGCDGVLCENDHDPFFRLLALGRTNNLCLQESQQRIRSQPALSFTMNVPSAQPSLLNIGNASSSFHGIEKSAKMVHLRQSNGHLFASRCKSDLAAISFLINGAVIADSPLTSYWNATLSRRTAQ